MARKKPPPNTGKLERRDRVSRATDTEDENPAVRQIEDLRASERVEWLDVEKLTPSDDVLNRISQRFIPPSEWFQEEDVL